MKRIQKRYLLTVSIFLPLCVAALVGWNYLLRLPCTEIQYTGAEFLEPASLNSLIDTTLTPPLIVDRLQRHPWIFGVHAVCYPTRVMQVKIDERQPWLLGVAPNGEPRYYLDAHGFMMPLSHQMTFDVPIVRGMKESYHPLKHIENQQVRQLAALMPLLPEEIISIISEFEIHEDGLQVVVRQSDSHLMAAVQVGETQWEQQIHKMYRFWTQQEWTEKDSIPDFIDLRFNGQIITRQTSI
ncbi:MAG: hypothetical protein OXF06_13900 [Bacteroidetes bacterium]|nr:hypothetical protein [Bacteroidota bacterium]MCY4225908.1 hypothetical protein [Bacteroidota bacterium]